MLRVDPAALPQVMRRGHNAPGRAAPSGDRPGFLINCGSGRDTAAVEETTRQAVASPGAVRTIIQEQPMSKIIIAALIVAFVAACAKKEEEVVLTAPVSEEPVFTGKYN
jgi:hypothetical protein